MKVRKFKNDAERSGAMVCCVGSCRKPSVYVKYLPDEKQPIGRVAYCEKHGEKQN